MLTNQVENLYALQRNGKEHKKYTKHMMYSHIHKSAIAHTFKTTDDLKDRNDNLNETIKHSIHKNKTNNTII